MNNNKPQHLNREDMAELVRLAPLISIDLIIENPQGQILVGMRNNEPAKGTYFVPGGRILKDETIAQAFKRIIKAELGIDADHKNAEFLGAFDHMYDTNFAQIPGLGTHYVVLAHKTKLEDNIDILSDDQHSELLWLDKDEILSNDKVHPNTKAYFRED